MLSGLTDTGQSMFERLVPKIEPSAKELEEQAQAVMYNKTVSLKEITVTTYDLSDKKEAKQYAKDLRDLYHGMQAHTHFILFQGREFVTAGDKPRWIAHIEWAEFALDVKATPTTAGAPK